MIKIYQIIQIFPEGGGILGLYLREMSSSSIALRGATAKPIQKAESIS